MQIKDSEAIIDLKIITPYIFRDLRGEYIETFNKREYSFKNRNNALIEFVEDDVSFSTLGVLRGLHGDTTTWKLIQCLLGEIYFVVVDMRVGSDTYLNWEAFLVNEHNRIQVLVPAGCANGHLCITNRCLFSYKQSQYYSGMENQFTVRWNDPKLGIEWPITMPILSVRDSSAPLL